MTSVVISGISGRFPNSDDLDDFYKKLLNKSNFTTPFGTELLDGYNVSNTASKLQTITKFDQTFFSLHSRLANVLDPMMRVFIEPCFEAIVDAGINPKSLAKSNTGVYTNSCISDDESLGCDEKITTNFWLLAHIRCLLANRIAYLFDLKGPSYSIDNSWTGGLEILRHAFIDIQEGRIDAAIVGVSHLLLNPQMNLLYNGMNKLSPDGKTRSFDQNASGYVRSEGVVVLFLQKSDQCLRSYGEVVHVDSLFYASLERPFIHFNENNLIDFFNNFYKNININPNDINFIEADGSAIKSLDSIELNIISQIFCKNRKSPLKIGSIKSNIGHSEGSSALMSVVKALLALHTDVITPNVNFQTPNTNMTKDMKVVTEPTPLDGDLVAVNSFGLCGSIAHILLKKNSINNLKEQKIERPFPRLVLVSSRTEKGIAKIIEKLENTPFNNDFISLVNQTFSEPINGLFYNGYTLLPTPTKAIHGSIERQPVKRPIWFVYAGMGSQWPGMGTELMYFKPFRDAIEECDKVFRPLGLDTIKIITSNDPTTFDDILNSFVGIAACHIGLTNILKAVGIEAEGYFGHSLGENGVSYADGCFNIKETCLGAYARGYASKHYKLKPGLMVSVGLNYKDLTDLPDSIDIGCHNSEDNTTISGAKEDIEPYLEKLKARNVFCRVVNSSCIAYHSRQVNPLAPKVLELFKKAVPNPKKRSSKWISTSIPEEEWDSPLAQTSSAEYHVNNFLHTVLFAEACTYVPENAIVIEIAPHGLMQSLLKRSLKSSCVNIPLCRRQTESPANFLLAALGQLHMHGVRPNIEALYEPVNFPVSRGTPSISPLVYWNHDDDWDVAVSNNPRKDTIEIDLLNKEYRSLFCHQVNGSIVSPLSLFLVELYKKLCSISKVNKDDIFVCEEYKMDCLVYLNSTELLTLKTEISAGTGMFEQQSIQNTFASGQTFFLESNIKFPKLSIDLLEKQSESHYVIDTDIFYTVLQQHQYQLKTSFVGVVQRLYVYENGCHAQIIYNNNLMIYLDSIMKIKIFLDLNEDEIPVFPHFLKGFMMSPEILATLKKDELIDVYLDFETGEIFAPGVYLSKLTCSNFNYDTLIDDNAKINSVHFVPHFTSSQKNVGTKKFLYCLIQLMMDNFSVKKKDAHLTMGSVNNCFPTDIIKHIQNKLSTVAQVDVIHGQNSSLSCDLLLCSYQSLVESTQHNAQFILVNVSPGDIINQNLNIVAHYQYKEEALMLIKNKTKPLKYTVLRPQSTPQWTKCLKTKDTPLLIWNDANINVQNTMKQINAMGHPVVCMFLLDVKAPRFSLDDSFYQQQLSKQLKVNVYKNGEWGSYYYENITPVPETKYPIIMPEFFGSAKYLGLNLKDNTSNISEEERKQDVGHIEFSGMIEGGGRIMGLAQYDTNNCTIIPDTDLTWNVPPEWNLQDAVTVPYVYTIVYHVLASKLNSDIAQRKKSILIHSGHTILGQAAISFSLSKGLEIYTTVPDVKYYVPILKHQFPKLQTQHMYAWDNEDFEVDILMETNGEGVGFVFSTICGEPFQASLRCVSNFGNFIQIGTSDMYKNKYMGTNLFLRSIDMFGVSEVDVYSLSKDRKKIIKQMIDKDIEGGIINPFKRKIYDNTETHEALRALKSESQETKIILSLTRNPNSDSLFTCLSNRSYLVVVNSNVKSHCWLNIIKWLLKRSARRIIISFESDYHTDYIDKCLNNLMSKYKDANFIFVPLICFNEKKTICSTLQHMVSNKIHMLDAVFTLKLDDKKLNNLDSALRDIAPSLSVFLCLQSNAEQICENRRQLNMPSLCVQSSSPNHLMRHLDTLSLECNAMATSPLVIVQPKVLEISNAPNIFQDIFPLSIEELILISSDNNINLNEEQYSFKLIKTKCPPYCSYEILPIFYISSLCSCYLYKLFNQLLYPTYISIFNTNNCDSIQNISKQLYIKIKNIQKQGPYTLIGEIFTSTIVIEMAKLIEKGGETVTVILLEGLPDSLESAIQEIADLNSPTLDIELLGDLVQVENNVSLHKSWNENMDQILSNVDEPSKQLCKLTLESLTNRIILSSKYARTYTNLERTLPNTIDKLKSTIVYICFSHTPILSTYNAFEKYHNGELILKVSEASTYLNLIEHKDTATIINDYANFPV